MLLIDSHVHLTDERLLPEAEAVVERARAAGVERVITVGTHLEDSREAVALAGRLAGVYAAVGIHPHTAATASESAFAAIAELAREPRVVGLGETGLDYYYDNSPREVQRAAFARLGERLK